MIPVGREIIGFTDSERYLTKLCENTFLTLWSQPNVFRAPQKELADLMVVFGDDIVVFSDKCCRFSNRELELAWQRWYRKAVEHSAKQLYRAAGWLRNHSDRIFLDSRCEKRFPFHRGANARIHLVAVAMGAGAACRKYVGGGSGSLFVEPSAPGKLFTVGDIDASKPFVHVFDDVSLDLVLAELDTVADFVRYLRKKEEFVRGGGLAFAAGEEELLAHYLAHYGEDGGHDFVFEGRGQSVCIDAGRWEQYAASAQRDTKREADQWSRAWDFIIENLAKNTVGGTLYQGSGDPLTSYEESLRLMASERRVARRVLGRYVLELVNSHTEDVAVRLLRTVEREHDYLFLSMARHGKDYDEYRRKRRDLLQACVEIAKLHFPEIKSIVGLGLAPVVENDASTDVCAAEFSGWCEGDAVRARKNASRLGLKFDVSKLKFAREEEFPAAHGTGRSRGG